LDNVLALIDKHVMIETVTLTLHGHLQTNVAHYVTIGSLIAKYHMLHIRIFVVCADMITAERIKRHSKWLELALPVYEDMPEPLQTILCSADTSLNIPDRLAVLRDYTIVMSSVQMLMSCGSAPGAIQDSKLAHNIWLQARLKSIGVYTYTVDTVDAAVQLAGNVDGLISNNVLLLNKATNS
jgi:hypothetical protein